MIQKEKIPVGIIGATGMVGTRFVTLLADHPWFEIKVLAASNRSAGQMYEEAVANRWKISDPLPDVVKDIIVQDASDITAIAQKVRLVFCAVDMDKEVIKKLENDYAAAGVAVVSNNSAHRTSPDVPMIMPEVNPDHVALIDAQRAAHGWSTGLIVVKCNCSIQSYVPPLTAWREFGPKQVVVTTLQAISGAGRTLDSAPELADNVIPYIGGEEEKSETEPLKIWGHIEGGKVVNVATPTISATCTRVPVSDGHMASVSVQFEKNPTQEELIAALSNYQSPIVDLDLPSAPEKFITYFDEPDRPQTRLDRDLGRGMAVSVGRLRPDPVLGWKFICLSHNTILGAAGGAVLMAELLSAKEYI